VNQHSRCAYPAAASDLLRVNYHGNNRSHDTITDAIYLLPVAEPRGLRVDRRPLVAELSLSTYSFGIHSRWSRSVRQSSRRRPDRTCVTVFVGGINADRPLHPHHATTRSAKASHTCAETSWLAPCSESSAHHFDGHRLPDIEPLDLKKKSRTNFAFPIARFGRNRIGDRTTGGPPTGSSSARQRKLLCIHRVVHTD
jgi:hypothetical protein